MNKRIWIVIFLLSLLIPVRIIFAQEGCPSTDRDPCANLQNNDPKKSECYQGISDACKNQSNTLSSQVNYMNSQIQLTTIRIEATQTKINTLLNEITQLENEVQRLEGILNTRLALLLHRIPAAYKRSVAPQFGILLFSRNVSDFIARAQYLSSVQKEDASLVFQVKATQNSYNESKQVREDKKTQLDQVQVQLQQQTAQLNQEKAKKQRLLDETNGNEATYQILLANARNELLAIQGILAGGGEEVEIGGVTKGDRIASIIEGESCNSNATHLHFMVTKQVGDRYNPLNPFGYLKKDVAYKNCSGSQCDSSDQDPFNPSGSWDWPIDPMIVLTQGFGNTWAVRNTWVGSIYQFHDGIDINGSSLSVKAMESGTLYRGFYTGRCRLQYVKVKHNNSDVATFYLHVNYTR